MPERIPEAAFRLLDDENFAHVATIMADGSLQVSPVWVAREDDTHVVFNTAKGRVKHRNLERDPRVAVSVHAQDDPYHYLQVRGVAEFDDDAGRAHIDEMSRKYLGRDYPFLMEGEERTVVRVSVESVYHRAPRGR